MTIKPRTRLIAIASLVAVVATNSLHGKRGLDSERDGGNEFDLRAAFSASRIRICEGRLADVAWSPGPIRARGWNRSLEIRAGVEYWLRTGTQVGKTWTWPNVALARAASGDFGRGAFLFENMPLIPMFVSPSSRDRGHSPRKFVPVPRRGGFSFGETRSDAAALHLQRAAATDDIQLVLRALVLADRALAIDPGLHEAHFNRGLALEKLGLSSAAVEAYRRSFDSGDALGWAEETTNRIEVLSQPSTKELWTNAHEELELSLQHWDAEAIARIVRAFPQQVLIASETEYLGRWARSLDRGDVLDADRNLAFVRQVGIVLCDSYGETILDDAVRAIDESGKLTDRRFLSSLVRGHRLYELATANRDAASEKAFDQAAHQFDVGGSPMGNVARYFSIVARFDARSLSESLKDLHQIAPRNSGYLALQALVDSQVATVFAERGDVYEALETYERAQRGFEHMHDLGSAARMKILRAHMLTLMGDPAEGWQVRRPALGEADRSGDASLIEFAINETSFDEIFERHEQTALSLSNVLPIPRQYQRPTFQISYLRSFAKRRPAQSALDSIDRRPISPDAANETRFVKGISLSTIQPREAEVLLSQCIEYSHSTGRTLMLPYVYLYRAISREAANHDDAAIADLQRSISLLEARRKEITRIDLRDAWIRIADDVFYELFEIYWRRGDNRRAFATGEERRGLVFRDKAIGVGTFPLSPSAIARRLRPGVAMVVFTSSNRHTLSTIIERNSVAMHRLEEPTSAWLYKRYQLVKGIWQGHDDEALSLSEDLYDSLISPFRLTPGRISKLIVVADRPLKDLPFSYLRDRRTGRYLVEQFELVNAPSASLFVKTGHSSPAHRPVSAVTIGDPAFDQRIFPSLPALPAARAESMKVSQIYPAGRALTGSQATLRNLAASIRQADVIDIAAHTTRSSREPLLLDLLLAADGNGSGASTLREISYLPLKDGSTVVIAGCATAISREPGDLTNFAGSFLAAGASSAVATLWDVDDDATREFALLFHRALSQGTSAAEATRVAQLSMLRSPNVNLHEARAWSGFQIYALYPSTGTAHGQ